MDPSEQERAEAWLKENWRHGPCPVCGADDWKRTPNLGQIENLDVGSAVYPLAGLVVQQRGRVPVLFVTCQNCGYFVTVNAILAGVRQPPMAGDGSDPSVGDSTSPLESQSPEGSSE